VNDPARVTRWPLVLAVVAVLAVAGSAGWMMLRSKPAEAPPTTTMAENALQLAGPEARFTWPRDARVTLYRIELYDFSSHLLVAAMLRDTSVKADTLLADSTRAGRWKVTGVTEGGTEVPVVPIGGFERH
jgi:hypothetical protein